MKRIMTLLLVIMVLASCFGVCTYAKENTVTVQIPDYQIVIDNASVYYADSVYPFLNYKNITYFPMTFEYCRAMDLTTGWLDGRAFMVAYNPCDDKLPVYGTTVNQKYNKAVIPDEYNIYVNAKKVDNSISEYPLLNFRNVTYFPMTWEYAVDNFGWQLEFKNNVLSITTVEDSDKRWYLEEKREKDAVFGYHYNKEIPLKNGSFEYEYVVEFYSVDFKTGAITELLDYVPEPKEDYNHEEMEVDVRNGFVYYKEQKLDIYIPEAAEEYVKPDNVEQVDFFVNASITDMHEPLKVVEVGVYTHNQGKEAYWGRQENYTFIKVDENLILLNPYTTVENVCETDHGIYFNTIEYLQTTFKHYKQNRRLWKLSKEGVLSEITYGDYNSIKIIGEANGLVYLKCLWSPENHMDFAPYSVSLVNDGYYTFDGQEINFVSPYIYSDFDVVSAEGDIIAVNNKLSKITRCEINPEYY